MERIRIPAHIVYDSAPLGSVIRYSDGTAKAPARSRASYSSPAYFTLHEGDFGEGGVIVVSVRRPYSVENNLRFEILERPAVGMVGVLRDLGDSPELLHLAKDRATAERWLANNRYSRAYLEEVSADEVSADAIEGRTAAYF